MAVRWGWHTFPWFLNILKQRIFPVQSGCSIIPKRKVKFEEGFEEVGLGFALDAIRKWSKALTWYLKTFPEDEKSEASL